MDDEVLGMNLVKYIPQARPFDQTKILILIITYFHFLGEACV